MIEILTSNEKGNDKLIAFVNGTIYKANPKTDQETDILASGLKAGSFDTTKLWEIKTRNCKEIRLQDGKPYIEIFWGRDGEEQLRITDEYKKYKLFESIKSNTPNANCRIEKWNVFRAGKKPMIAFFIVLALFLWTLYYAIQAQRGYVYYLEDGRYFSLTGIILGIASLGLVKVFFLFSVLLGIALFAFIQKARKPPVMNRIIIAG
ncbi:MAG TPA: hypothetical protein VGQ09_00795 [Chitinophagaceae bacterium]|jgi:hypothetical protein|nr:hypothetical protein [Chitinophagaceae bacterium]